ncbi:PLD nuclease N-terminal domain-containing protein [Microbacterium sp. X-17]|uniref:PLD nuclease N-terminal domain-containing protein n=1 Tax=Microbacterium sp. X-17 TaxID=3144404 RepID=UPI0031F485F1
MARLLIILALLATVFWVYSVIDCIVQPALRHRGVGKVAWVFIVLLLPVIGGILWFTLGRASRRAMEASAPDDDPEFLRRIGTVSDQDERIRRLEEDLARLDGEDDTRKKKKDKGSDAAHRPSPDTDDDGPRARG